jgi:uncharacterized protein (TIRG00374 family)
MRSTLAEHKDNKIIWYIAATALLLGLAYFADLGDFVAALSNVDPFYMSLAVLSGMSVFLVWGYIWFSFFSKVGIDASLLKSYQMFMGGNFMNSVTPLGQLGGEPFMAYVISENTDSSYEKALSSVISSDLVNTIPFITYTAIIMIYVYFYGGVNTAIQASMYAIVSIGLTIIAAGYMLWSRNQSVENVLRKVFNYAEKKLAKGKYVRVVRNKLREYRSAFENAGEDRGHLIRMTIISHLFPLTQFLALYLIFLGMDISPNLIAIYFSVILSGLAMFSPTPGGSGTFEATFSGVIMFFYPEIGLSTALATAILFRLTTYWPGIPIGYISLMHLRGSRK